MLLNLLIGAGLIAGSLAIPVLLVALCAGRSVTMNKRYASRVAEYCNLPRAINEPLGGRRLGCKTNDLADVDGREIAPLTKAS